MIKIKLSVLKNRLPGILSVRHPSFSVFSGILSVLGILPIPEEIQLLMYAYNQNEIEQILNFNNRFFLIGVI